MAIVMRAQETIIGNALISMIFFLPTLSTAYMLTGVDTMKPTDIKATKVAASEAVIGIGESGSINAMVPGEFHP